MFLRRLRKKQPKKGKDLDEDSDDDDVDVDVDTNVGPVASSSSSKRGLLLTAEDTETDDASPNTTTKLKDIGDLVGDNGGPPPSILVSLSMSWDEQDWAQRELQAPEPPGSPPALGDNKDSSYGSLSSESTTQATRPTIDFRSGSQNSFSSLKRGSLKNNSNLTRAQIRARRKAAAEVERIQKQSQAELNEIFILYGVDPASIKPDEIPRPLPDWTVKPVFDVKTNVNGEYEKEEEQEDDKQDDEETEDDKDSSTNTNSLSERLESFNDSMASFDSVSVRTPPKSSIRLSPRGPPKLSPGKSPKKKGVSFVLDPSVKVIDAEDKDLPIFPTLFEDDDDDDGDSIDFCDKTVRSSNSKNKKQQQRQQEQEVDRHDDSHSDESCSQDENPKDHSQANNKNFQDNGYTKEREMLLEAQQLLARLRPGEVKALQKVLEKSGQSSKDINDLISKSQPWSLIIVSSKTGLYHSLDPSMLSNFINSQSVNLECAEGKRVQKKPGVVKEPQPDKSLAKKPKPDSMLGIQDSLAKHESQTRRQSLVVKEPQLAAKSAKLRKPENSNLRMTSPRLKKGVAKKHEEDVIIAKRPALLEETD